MATVIDTFVVEYLFRFSRTQLQRMERRVDQAKRRLEGFSRGLVIPGAAITAGLGLVTKTTASFEDALNRAAAAGNLNAEQLAAVNEQARELGATTRFTATDAANAQATLFQAGLQLNEVLAVTPQVLSNAAAGEIDLARSAELVTQAVNSFGLSMGDSQRIVDLAGKSFISGTVSIEEMLDMLARGGATLRGFNIDAEDAAAVFVRLRTNGVQAETAARGFSSILTRLAVQTGETKRGLEELGGAGLASSVQFAVAAGDYTSAFRLIEQGLAGLPDARQAELRGLIFGLEQQRVGNVILQDIALIEQLQQALRDNDGESQRLADTMERGLGGSLRSLRSAFEAAQLSAGDREGGLGFSLESVIQTGTDFLRWLSDVDGSTQTWLSSLLVLGPVMLATSALLGVMAFSLRPVFTLFRGLIWLTRLLAAENKILRMQLFLLTVQQKATAVWAFIVRTATLAWTAAQWLLTASTSALNIQLLISLARQGALVAVSKLMVIWGVAVRVATLAWTAAQWLLNAALTANPIGIVIVLIGALIGAVVLAIKYWDQIAAAVAWAWNKLQEFAQGMPGWLSVVLAVIAPFIGVPLLIIRHWDKIRGFFVWLWDQIVGIFKAGWDKVSPIVDAAKSVGRFFGFGGDDDGEPDATPPGGGAGGGTAGATPGTPAELPEEFTRLSPDEQQRAIQLLPPEAQAQTIQLLPPEQQQQVIRVLPPEQQQQAFLSLPPAQLAALGGQQAFGPPTAEGALPSVIGGGATGEFGGIGQIPALPVGPFPTPADAGAFGGGPVSQQFDIDIDLTIQSPTTVDSSEIAANVAREVRDQVQAALANVDNDIDR